MIRGSNCKDKIYTVLVQTHIRLETTFNRTRKKKKSNITQVHRASMMNTGSFTLKILEETKYKYDCILKYKMFRKKIFLRKKHLVSLHK